MNLAWDKAILIFLIIGKLSKSFSETNLSSRSEEILDPYDISVSFCCSVILLVEVGEMESSSSNRVTSYYY